MRSLRLRAIPGLGRLAPGKGLPIAILVKLYLSTLGVVVECDTDSAAVMAVVLTDDLLCVQLPQTCVVVTAGCYEICAVGTEGTVPHPTLMAR